MRTGRPPVRTGRPELCADGSIIHVPFGLSLTVSNVTVNFSTVSLDLLWSDDFCGKASNIVLVKWPPQFIAETLNLPPFQYPAGMEAADIYNFEARFAT